MPVVPKIAEITMDIADEDSVYWKLGVLTEIVTTTFFEEPNMTLVESRRYSHYTEPSIPAIQYIHISFIGTYLDTIRISS